MTNNRVGNRAGTAPDPDLELGPLPTTPPPPADALTPAQRRILDVLRDLARPTGLADLAVAADLHPNTVREHLEALQGAGAVRRRPAAPVGRGRPAWLYEPARAASGVPGLGVAEYAGLVSSMAAALAESSTDPARAAITAGLRWGSGLVAHVPPPTHLTTDAARRQVVTLFEDLGFAPESELDTDPHATTIRLTRCPLLDAARAHPDVVCGIHLGIARAALQAWGAPVGGTSLHTFSDPGYCRLQLAGADATSPPPGQPAPGPDTDPTGLGAEHPRPQR